MRTLVVVALIALAAVRACHTCSSPQPAPGQPLRIATFNIEEFPKHARQISGAFAELATLGAAAIAVQEIKDPDRFTAEARARLGGGWQFVYASTMPVGSRFRDHVGVLFDTRIFELVSTALHGDTRIDGRQKPTFEARLRPRAGGAIVDIYVIHFKSGSEARPLRAHQFAALSAVLRREHRAGERAAVLGDFNATDDRGDRADLAALARETGLTWATEGLACSAFWDRSDGCPTSRLDHVLTWAPGTAEARGACAEGCELRDRCPLYADEVSDHCPIVVAVP